MNEHALRAVFVSLRTAEDREVLPLGAATAAAALVQADLVRRGDMKILAAGVDEPHEALEGKILASSPSLVGFSLYCWNSTASIELAARLRAAYPKLLLIAGGPDAERLAAAAREAPHVFDAVFLGEAEESLVAWVRDAATGGGQAHARGTANPAVFLRGKAAAPATLASPWLAGLLEPRAGGQVAWELTRGCPFRCAYCYEGRGSSGVRRLPDERLERELALFVERGVGEIFVLDPTFNVQPARALALLRRFADKGGGIAWNFEIRAELLDRPQAEAFASMPCSLQIGLQSVRPEVLAAINRDMDRKKFAAKVGLLNAAGAVFGLDLIYGLPGDTLAGFRESLDYALSLAPNHLDIFPLAVLPGTELAERREALGLVADEEPPYLLKRHASFGEADMASAARLARACGLFYTAGRAVPWFLSALRPLRMAPAAFLAGFAEFIDARAIGAGSLRHAAIESLQIEYLGQLYKARGVDRWLAAALDLVRYYGAWSRAFAEGERSRVKLSHPLREVESPGFLDIERHRSRGVPRPCEVDIGPGGDGVFAKIAHGRA
ncbi:radical SAM protein [bacterium]|nr:radical SAM protein [bacterium]